MKRYLFFVITFLIVSIIGTIFFGFKHNTNSLETNIRDVLKTSSYSYLPDEAKEFIIDAYEETGEVILTEKNKVSNTPYLNPKYVEYLSLSKEEKEATSVVPNTYLIDYMIVSNDTLDGSFPSSYDLRNVNGNKYITDLKNQSTLGVCWAFATSEIAESYLMIKNNTPSNPLNFSVRQMDYALSTDGISDIPSVFGLRTLGSGGNFLYSSYLLVNGVSLINDNYMPYSTSLSKKTHNEIFNMSRSLYEVNETLDVPQLNISSLNLSNQVNVDIKNNYLNLIKKHIMEDGGAYVGTEGPGYSCSSNYDGNTILRVDGNCTQGEGHAMQVIGWDDNYTYKYCKNGSFHTDWTTSCSSSNTVTGTGAWILRNSWGNSISYLYLAYDSNDDLFSFITDMTSMDSKDWDHSYYVNLKHNNSFYYSSNSSVSYKREYPLDEVVNKVKIYAYASEGSHDITICTNGNSNCTYAGTISNSYPGYVTLDVSSKNIILNNETFSVIVSSSTGNHIINSPSVFTSAISDEPIIETSTIELDGKYSFNFDSYTRNIPDGEIINYKLFALDGTDMSSYLNVTNNVVILEKVMNSATISNSLPAGKYVLKASYGEYSFSTDFLLYVSEEFTGSGTSSSPYLINTIEQLRKIASYNTSYFKLNADLDLTNFYGNYNSIPVFSGSFDGNGHSIKGLNVPLFNKISGSSSKTVTVKNLTLLESNIDSSNIAGAVASEITDNGYVVSVNGINIIGGSITSSLQAGSLIGKVTTSGSNKTKIYNIYSSASVKGSEASGLVGMLYSSNTSLTNSVSIYNIQNVGINLSKVKSGYIVGHVQNVIPNIYNFIVTGQISNDNSDYLPVIGYVNNIELINNANIKDGYYANVADPLLDITFIYSGNSNNLQNKLPWELTNISSVNSWTSYSTYWEAKTIDDIPRMVKLKNAKITFTSFDEILVKDKDSVNLFDYLNPKIPAAQKITFESNNTDICTIESDGTINGLKVGNCFIHVKSYYDGYENDVPVTVYNDNLAYITFDANGGTGSMEDDYVIKNSSYVIKLNSFTKTGYYFDGWNTKKDGTGEKYTNGGTISNLSDNITLYAIWKPITYTVKFNVEGNETTVNSINATYDVSITLPNNPYYGTGYEPDGWNTKENGTGTKYSDGQSVKNLLNTSGTITLYSMKKAISYKVVYHFNNGTSDKVTKTYKYDESFTMKDILTVPTGYHISNWNTKADGTGTKYYLNTNYSNLSSISDTVINLYAITDKNAYVINYDLNGASGAILSQTVTYDNEISIKDNTFAFPGHTFKCWNTNKDGTGTNYYPYQIVKNLSTENGSTITLYAIYDPISYKIKYHYQFNDLTSVDTLLYDEVSTIMEPIYYRNLEFLGWNTKPDGSGITYNVGDEISNLVTASNQSFDLYAIWGENPLFTINNYLYDDLTSLLQNIANNTSYSSYITNFNLSSGLTISSYRNGNLLNENDIIGTGTVTKIMKGDKLISIITNVVKGDVNGDGKITSADYVSIRKHIMETAIITDMYQGLGADANQDNKISSADYIKIRKYIMNGGTF